MPIDANGANLTLEEKHLICICRAILRNSKIIVLEEATGNIDLRTEHKIQRLITNEFDGRTVITIAHRVNTVMQSDKVIVLSQGRIIDFDEPSNLEAIPDSQFALLIKEMERAESDSVPTRGL